MNHYNSLLEALLDLEARGYTFDFNRIDQLDSKLGKIRIVECYRFEGTSSSADSSVIYALETDSGLKGTLLDTHGTYSGKFSDQITERMTLQE